MTTPMSIYPTSHKVEDVLRRSSAEGCLWDHKVLTFPQLIALLWRDTHPQRITLDSIGERLALEEALRRGGWTGAASPGVVNHLLGVIRRFKSAGLIPDDIADAVAALNDRQADRIRSLAAVFANYEAILASRRLADAHDRERAVLDLLHQAELTGTRPRSLHGIDRLLVAEVYDFSLLQFMIVASLIRTIGDAEITVQAQPYRVDAARFVDMTWNRFVGEESIADKVLPDFVRRGGRGGRLGFLLEQVFNPAGFSPRTPPPADDTVRVIRAVTREAEIDEVCRSIRRILDSGSVPASRIAIVARDLGPYAVILESAFARFKLPLRLFHGAPMAACAPVRTALDILRAASAGVSREALQRIFLSPHVSRRIAACAALLNRSGYLTESSRPLAACLEASLKELSEQASSETDPERRERLSRRLERWTGAKATLEQIAAGLATLSERVPVGEHLVRLHRLMRALELDPARTIAGIDRNIRIWSEFIGLLERLGQAAELITPGRAVKSDEFAAMVEMALADERTAQASDAEEGAVRAFPVLDARGLDFDVVFVIGLTDGAFPLLNADDPILPDHVASAINRPLASALRKRLGQFAPAALQPVLRTSAHRNSEDYFLFFLALSMPEQGIVLSYPVGDAAGATMARSPFVDEIFSLLGGDLIEEQATGRYLLASPADCYTDSDFLGYAARHGLLPAISGIGHFDNRLESLAATIARAWNRERYLSLPPREETGGEPHADKLARADRFNGRVGADQRLSALVLGPPDSPRPWNGAMFSELASCGYKFFAHHVLRLADDEEEPGYETGALETGSMVHDILHEIMAVRPDFRDRETALAQIKPILARIAAGLRAVARDCDFFDIRWETIKRTIAEVVEFEVNRRISEERENAELMLEHEFVFALADFAGRLPDGRSQLPLTGRIDRVELYRDADNRIRGLDVIDYKTSRRAGRYAALLDPEKQFGRTEFQIAIYLMGMIAELSGQMTPETAINGSYLVLRSRDKLKSDRFDQSQIEPLPDGRRRLIAAGTPSLAERLIELAAEAAGGNFDVDPLVCDDYCAYRRVCRNFRTVVRQAG